MPKLPIGEQAVNRPGNSSSSSPQPVPGPPGTKALLPTPIGPPLHMGATPTPLDTRPLYLHNGVNPLAFTGGAIPKRATPAQPSTTPGKDKHSTSVFKTGFDYCYLFCFDLL